jgi:hypothetical protein
MPRGHFAALEQPELLADVIAAVPPQPINRLKPGGSLSCDPRESVDPDVRCVIVGAMGAPWGRVFRPRMALRTTTAMS